MVYSTAKSVAQVIQRSISEQYIQKGVEGRDPCLV